MLHLIGRHPLLTAEQLAQLLGTTSARILRLERELVESGYLRPIEMGDFHHNAIVVERETLSSLGLFE